MSMSMNKTLPLVSQVEYTNKSEAWFYATQAQQKGFAVGFMKRQGKDVWIVEIYGNEK